MGRRALPGLDQPLPPVEHHLRADRGAPRRFHRDRLHLDPVPPPGTPCDPGNQRLTSVAVGTEVTSRPPRRSRRAAFPHRAPAEGQTRPAFGAWAAHTVSPRGAMPRGTCLVRLCVRGMRRHRPLLPAGSLPSTPSAAAPRGLVRGFIGTMDPSDSSDLPVRLRLLAFPNRPGTAVAAAGGSVLHGGGRGKGGPVLHC